MFSPTSENKEVNWKYQVYKLRKKYDNKRKTREKL